MLTRITAVLLALLCVAMPAFGNDISNSTWTETDASNTAPAPNGWSGTTRPTDVEPTARSMMGAIKRWHNRISATETSGGSANAQTLTYDVAPEAYRAGDSYVFIAGLTNTGSTTLNVNSLGAKTIKLGTSTLAGGEIITGRPVIVYYDGENFQLANSQLAPVDVRNFGAACDGVTNDAISIQAAIDAASIVGTDNRVAIPVGKTCSIGATTLQMGNGTSSAWSTTQGVVLIGSPGVNTNFGAFGNADVASARIKYSGTDAAIKVAGPVSGWGLQGIQIECSNGVGSIGLSVVSGEYGDTRNLSILSCRTGIRSDTVASLPAGIVLADSIHNKYENIIIKIVASTAATYYGIIETGNINANSDFNDYNNVSITASAVSGATVNDLWVGASDSSIYRNIHMHGTALHGTGGVTRNVVTLDYDNGATSQWPSGTTFANIENTKGLVRNNGTPLSTARANYWNNQKYTNGGTAPLLSNLINDFIKGEWTPTLRGSTTAGTVTYAANGQIGDYEINGFTVTIRFHLQIASLSGAGGVIELRGLPVPFDTQASTLRGGCSLTAATGVTYAAGFTWMSAWVDSANDSIVFMENGSAQASTEFISPSQVASTAKFEGSCTYRRKQVF